MLDLEAGHDSDHDEDEELRALEEEEALCGEDFIDDNPILELSEDDDQENDVPEGDTYGARSVDVFGQGHDEQELAENLRARQRLDIANGRPALDFSEAAAMHAGTMEQMADPVTGTTFSVEPGCLSSAFSGHIQQPHDIPDNPVPAPPDSEHRPGIREYPGWNPDDPRITEVRCRAGNRGILLGDPSNPVSYFSIYVSAIGENSDVSPTIIDAFERLAYAKNEHGHPICIELAASLERG